LARLTRFTDVTQPDGQSRFRRARLCSQPLDGEWYECDRADRMVVSNVLQPVGVSGDFHGSASLVACVA